MLNMGEQLNFSPSEWANVTRRAIQHRFGRRLPSEYANLAISVRADARMAEAIERIGPVLRIQDVVSLTGDKPSTIHRRKENLKLIAVRAPGANYDLFPRLQFDETGKVHDWVEPLLEACESGPGAVAFLTDRLTSLNGQCYAQRLLNGDSSIIDQMLDRAMRFGDQNL